jgi:YesN/AraC family two-component response regulator
MVFDKGVLEQRNLRFILQPEQKVNILLVDDQPKNLLVLEAILDSLGQNLVKANSGEQALKCVLNQDFAVILLDVQMPGMDGLETAKLIRERERSQHTPIIFLTAFSTSVSQMFKGYSLGAVDYLIKPIEPEILTSKVAVFVELFKKTAEVKQQAAQLATVNAKLRESEQRFLSLSACSPVGIFLTNMELGADGYLTKPCKVEDLLGAISTRLEKQAVLRQCYSTESQPGKGTQLNDIALLPDSQSIFPTCSPQLNKVFQFIEDNYHQPINLCNVAQAVGYSPAYLTNLVKRQTKRAIHGWIVERRMTEARSLLLKTDEPVNQIAVKVGYPDAGHFTRQFRQLYKMPPKVWRNTHCTQLSCCASNLQ